MIYYLTFAEFLQTAEGVVSLISALVALIGTGFGVYGMVKSFVKTFKDKKAKEQWALIMSIADSAMKEAEKSLAKGEDKKQLVIDTVKAACKTAGIDADEFIDQLSDYIDQCIDFVNGMKK